MAASAADHFHRSSNDDCAEQDQESFSYAMQIGLSLALPMSMHVAIQLEIFQIMAKAGPDAKLSAKEIADQLPTKNPEAPSMLDRILKALASHSIVGCSAANDEQGGNPQRLYSLTPVSKFFVRNEDGVSLGPLMNLLQDKVFLDSWFQLKDAILEGGVPFDRVHGTHAFEYPGRDPRFNQVFNTAMFNHTTLVVKKILESYKGFEKLNQLVDVGGGLGVTLGMITSKYTSIKGINFDLPHVIKHAPAYPGVEHVGGNMFERVPRGDAVFMKWILHDWSDEHCVKLLKNCYEAIPDDGKVIVVDAVIPILPEPNSFVRGISMQDVLMMTQNPGGKERTRPEFEALATEAGFSGIRYECFVCNFCVMEFFKHHQTQVAGRKKLQAGTMESSAKFQFHHGGSDNDSAGAQQDQESFSYATQIGGSLTLPMSMHAVIQLDIFEIIAKAGPDAKLSANEIAAQLPTKNPEAPSMLDRILKVLASHCIVGCSLADDEQGGDHQRLYSLMPVSKYFVRNEDGVSLGPLMNLAQDKIYIDSWSQLKDAILEGGIPFHRVHGTHAFEYHGRDPRFNQVFNIAMINHTTVVMKKMLERYKGFEKLNQVVDVGGGLGVTLSMITSKYPSVKGINFDLPHVTRHAPAYPGVEHAEGDMFDSVPRGDAIFMKWILHDWSDEHCMKLLKNCYKAIPDDGKVIVVEAVLPTLLEPNAFMRGISMMDLIMMTHYQGGKERTKQEFEALATKAGFSGIRYECFACNFFVMEFFK